MATAVADQETPAYMATVRSHGFSPLETIRPKWSLAAFEREVSEEEVK